MPSTYAHFRFGQDVLKVLPLEMQKVISQNENIYNMAVHGPDLLFYYKPLSSNAVNAVGHKLHAKPGIEFFRPAAEVLKKKRYAPEYMAFVYGYLCHFALDLECHGYVNSRVEKEGVSHSKTEVEYDRHLLLKDGCKDPVSECLVKHIRPGLASAKVMKRFYPGISTRKIFKSQKAFIFYLNLLTMPGKIKRFILFSLMHITGNDDLKDLTMSYVPDPRCNESNKRLDELYEKAIETAVKLITGFASVASGKENWPEEYHSTFDPKEDKYEI